MTSMSQANSDRSRVCGSGSGWCFRTSSFYSHLSVIDNTCRAQRVVLKHRAEEARERALSLPDRVGLKDKEPAYPMKLSGGQQQRIAIARPRERVQIAEQKKVAKGKSSAAS